MSNSPDLIQAAADSGIKYSTLWRRINKQGMTLEEACSEPLKSKSQIMRERWHEPDSLLRRIHQKTYYAVCPNSEQFTITNLNEWCKVHGWNRLSLQQRIKHNERYKGWTVYKALTPSQKPTEDTTEDT